LAKKKYRVGILDGDLSGASVSLLFDVAEAPEIIHGGMHPVEIENGISIMSFPLLMPTPSAPLYWSGAKCAAFAKQFWTDVIWDNLDFLLIDTPSNTDEVTQIFFT
jgi:Mrp family chromosome partitioning ATPase